VMRPGLLVSDRPFFVPPTWQSRRHLADLFHTTHKVKTQQVANSRVSNMETSSLPPTSIMLWGRCHWYLTLTLTKYCNTVLTKIIDFFASNAISSIPNVVSTSVRLHCELVPLLFLQTHREAFLQLQEFSLRTPTTSSITVARLSPKLALGPRWQGFVPSTV
jgi:hypothetical protein